MKKNDCIVCGADTGVPFFVSEGGRSLTTMMVVLAEATIVRFCERCGHLQTDALPDLEHYYSQQYQVLVNSEDEDQLVVLRDGRTVLRNVHQLDTMLEKIQPSPGARILDFGCAKSVVMRLLLNKRPDVKPHLFDVTDMYVPFWRKFVPEGNWATYQIPAGWEEKFDLITSFFALEHVEAPGLFIQEIRRLLKPDGGFYCVVPNAYENVADFIVADHVSHFSSASIAFLLEQGGFDIEQIDDSSHPGAWIFVGRKRSARTVEFPKLDGRIKQQAAEMADYWRTFASRVREFESEHVGRASAIYGSGFYGMYLMTCLRNPDHVRCFLDQNPHRQGQRLYDLPVLGPADIPHDIGTVYVGLNPRIARSAIANVPSLTDRDIDLFYP